MTPYHTSERATFYCGDNRIVMAEMEENSVDSIVCDPPYEIGFMQRGWDSTGIAYEVRMWEQCLRILKPGGRLVVVTFHSLEDRIVKRFFADRSRDKAGGSRHAPEIDVPEPTFTLLTKGALAASGEETETNPRSRSAKLRAGQRTAVPARAVDFADLGVPQLIPAARSGKK